ncbi:uncharacterized protein LOC144025437 isoform X3 [Festucalex cinctus]
MASRTPKVRQEEQEKSGLQQRQMSSTPGGSGENILYAVMCGGAIVGAVTYTFKNLSTDAARYNDRISKMNAWQKNEWTPKPWPPKKCEEEPVEEASEVAAADSESETVVEEVEEIIVEGAEVVAEMAEEVAVAAQQVEVIADEVVKVVEETAHGVAEQVAAEDPKSNGRILPAFEVLWGKRALVFMKFFTRILIKCTKRWETATPPQHHDQSSHPGWACVNVN